MTRAEPLVTRETGAAEAVVRVLEQAGIDTVFGMSGGVTGRLLAALGQRPEAIRTVLVRHEELATCAADGYARLTGRPAVALGQGCWIFGHGVVGTLEALLSGHPMIILGDLSDAAPFGHHAPYQAGTGDWGTWNAPAAFSGITKRVMVARDPVQAVQLTQLAVKHAMAGDPGPVAVLFDTNALAGTVGPNSVPAVYATGGYVSLPSPAEPNVSTIVNLIRTSERPVALIGGGVNSATAREALMRVAEAAGLPVTTSPAGKGAFPEEHALALGVYGTYGTAVANEFLAEADAVLAIGTRLSPSDTAFEDPRLLDPTRQKFVQVDVDPRNAGWTFPAETVVSDAAAALQSVARQLCEAPVAEALRRGRQEAVRQARLRNGPALPHAGSDAMPMHPQRAIAELREALPDDAIVCADAGENRLFMSRYFQTRAGGDYLQPAGAGGMGYAIPAAFGARVRYPDRPVVAVCGDGGLGMALPALLTGIEEQLPILVVVFNNQMLGWSFHGQLEKGMSGFKCRLGDFNYAAIAQSAGWTSRRVTRPGELSSLVADALQSQTPVLLEVPVSTAERFSDLRWQGQVAESARA